MSSRHALVLAAVLAAVRPLVRLLVRHGVGHGALAQALKRVFVAEAEEELQRQGMARTHSAVSLLSGVHRRDVRALAQAGATEPLQPTPPSQAGEVVARWLAQAGAAGAAPGARVLPRSGERSFDSLVAAVSRDVRPRAMLDELRRLGAVREVGDAVELVEAGFAPRLGFAEQTGWLAVNLHDHAAAAVANVQDDARFLDQAIYVDALSGESVEALRHAAREAWQSAYLRLLPLAQERFDADAAQPPVGRRQRVRFGVYFYSDEDGEPHG